MPNGTGMEGHAFTDSQVRALEKRVERIEKVIGKLIEAIGHDHRELRTYVLQEVMRIMQ